MAHLTLFDQIVRSLLVVALGFGFAPGVAIAEEPVPFFAEEPVPLFVPQKEAVPQGAQGELSFSLQSGTDFERIWSVKYPQGQVQDLSQEEEMQLLAEEVFPRIQAKAIEGQAPEVWQVGFFYLDGIGTEPSEEQAEAAFRKGLELNRPEGLYVLGDYFAEKGRKASGAAQAQYLLKAESIYREVLGSGYLAALRSAVPLAQAHLYGWYGLEEDPERAGSILAAAEEVAPQSPYVRLWRAKVFARQKRYEEAFDYAERAQQGFRESQLHPQEIEESVFQAGAVKIAAAVLGKQISKIDSEEFLEISKRSMGITGAGAWVVPGLLGVLLACMAWMTLKGWRKERIPSLRLSIGWFSLAILAAGIGLNISLPGIHPWIGNWIGAIMVTATVLVLLVLGAWPRLFGSGSLYPGGKGVLIAMGILVGGFVAMQVVAQGYGKIYEWVSGIPIGKQLASLFIESETWLQLVGTVLVVGVAIPLYEEVFFRGFLYDALEERWNPRVALVASSVVFALAHGITFIVPLLFLSFALGWLKQRSGNLRMCFLLHAVNNSSAVLIGHFLGS